VHQWTRPSLGGEAGGRSPGFICLQSTTPGPESRRSIPALTPAAGRNDSNESTARVALQREPGRVSIFKRQAYPQRGVYRRRKCVSGHTRWASSTLSGAAPDAVRLEWTNALTADAPRQHSTAAPPELLRAPENTKPRLTAGSLSNYRPAASTRAGGNGLAFARQYAKQWFVHARR
jgi:hypothetical protein